MTWTEAIDNRRFLRTDLEICENLNNYKEPKPFPWYFDKEVVRGPISSISVMNGLVKFTFRWMARKTIDDYGFKKWVNYPNYPLVVPIQFSTIEKTEFGIRFNIPGVGFGIIYDQGTNLNPNKVEGLEIASAVRV